MKVIDKITKLKNFKIQSKNNVFITYIRIPVSKFTMTYRVSLFVVKKDLGTEQGCSSGETCKKPLVGRSLQMSLR